MSSIVRRVPNDDDHDKLELLAELGLNDTLVAVEKHSGKIISVTSYVINGPNPRIRLCWSVPPHYFDDKHRLFGFRRSDRFTKEDVKGEADGLSILVEEKRADGSIDEFLGEGQYFYTFVLHGPHWCRLYNEDKDVKHFKVQMPGAGSTINRLKQQLEKDDLSLKVLKKRKKLEDYVERQERGREPKEELGIVELLLQQQQEIEAVKRSHGWKKLSADNKQRIIREIEEEYHRIIRSRRK